MSLLHVQSSVSASLKKTGDAGKIKWDGKDPRFVVMEGISKSVEVKVGDTVLTSKYSYNFPPDKLIGTVAAINIDRPPVFTCSRSGPLSILIISSRCMWWKTSARRTGSARERDHKKYRSTKKRQAIERPG